MIDLLYKVFCDFSLPLLLMIPPKVVMIDFINRLTLLSPDLLGRRVSLGPLAFHTTEGALGVGQHFLVIDVFEFETLYKTVGDSEKVVHI